VDPRLYRTILLLLAVGLVLWAFGLILAPFLVPIAWAMCFVALTLRPYRALARAWKRPRLAAMVMTVATALGILLPLFLVTYLLFQEASSVDWKSLGTRLREATPGFHDTVNRFLGRFNTSVESIVSDGVASVKSGFADVTLGVAGAVVKTIIGLLMMLGTQYFLYRDAGRLRAFVKDVLPVPEEATDEVIATLHRTTVAAIVGGLVVALLQGAIGGVGLAIAGIDGVLTWSLVMAAVSFLPVGGTALVWGPAVLWLFATDRTGQAWFLLVWGGVVLSLSDNLMRPILLKRTGASEIHPLLLLFAIVSGVGVFGPSGIVFGPLLVAVLTAVAKLYREHVAPAVRPVRPT
jgi:predicted PurR-regulated permease PerM